jgi:hypothetical protein
MTRAVVRPEKVLRVWDHLRLRLRPTAQAPAHAEGTDGRTPAASADTIYLSIYGYLYDIDGGPGFAAAVKTDRASGVPELDLLLADSRDIAERHRRWNDEAGYTPLGPYLQATFARPVDPEGVTVVVSAPDLDIRARWTKLGPPELILGAHPRHDAIRVVSLIREAGVAQVHLNGARVPGVPFPHRGFEHWVGRAFSSASVQMAETYLGAGGEPFAL